MQDLRKTLASAFIATALLGGTLAAPAVADTGPSATQSAVTPAGHGGDHGNGKDKKCHHHEGYKHQHGYWHKHDDGKKHWHKGYWHWHKDYKHCHKHGDKKHDHEEHHRSGGH
ncbi:hypothetical protein GCM10011374_32900 [Kocuria dechangensis]|uniref:Uncharacterized protein n=1 Tax=Kocuria dechangensis TaxID=1176249 RepID=A0A917H3E0_9MICC|nr:hypothetical protein [Kocuria dechangensis]GGG66271.1 hypothetical protein GCM10011374_32900 [Kocuria dechangensis]